MPAQNPLDCWSSTRRDWLLACMAMAVGTSMRQASGAARALPTGLADEVVRFLRTLAREDGGFAWPDQPTSHLSPTYAAIGAFRMLGVDAPDPMRHAAFVDSHHPATWKKLEQEHREFDLMQMQTLTWLGAETSRYRDRVLSWTRPVGYLKQYERHGFPVFRHQVTAFLARQLLGLSLDTVEPQFIEYLNSRRRTNGSFGNTPADDGSDGNILNTLWGLQSLETLNRLQENRDATIDWVIQCQGHHQPEPKYGRGRDIAYLWASVRCLELLGDDLEKRIALTDEILKCRCAEGGFSDRPGWQPNAMATFYAVDALSRLPQRRVEAVVSPAVRSSPLPDGLNVYSIQIQAHGQGSPAEAVELARSLRIHLWGAKNAKPGWIQRAQKIADQQQAPVTFFVANEEYGTWVDFPGMGTYSHTSDIIAPAGAEIGPSLANAGVVTWEQFREQRLKPLEAAGGRLIWQFGENEELVRTLLDDSVDRGGYAAVSTFHFGNPDFTNSEPFLKRYRGRLAFVALQDAHGAEPWWFSDMTAGFRTLFLAKEPTWDEWLAAMRNDWVISVRRDAVTDYQLRMHGGSDDALDFVRRYESQWRWWDNAEIARPMLSLVALRPGDEFEAGRPESGVALRIRCAWTNTTQGQPKSPLVELVGLSVDGQQVMPERVELRAGRGSGISDVFHRWADTNPAAGPRLARAVGRIRETGVEIVRELRF
jgi:prenyltransferase beta subunit